MTAVCFTATAVGSVSVLCLSSPGAAPLEVSALQLAAFSGHLVGISHRNLPPTGRSLYRKLDCAIGKGFLLQQLYHFIFDCDSDILFG